MSAFALSQSLVNGVVAGCIYALIALSIVIIFKSTEVINFAGGDVVMVGGFVGMATLSYFELPYLVVFILGAATMFIVGAVFERVVLHKVIGQASQGHAILVALVIATVGLSFAMKGVVRAFPGADEVRRLSPAFRGPPVEIGPVLLQRQDLAIIVIAVALMLGLFFLFQHTFIGKALRATSQNPRAAVLVGIPIQLMRLLVWGISFALAGVSGILIGGKIPMSVDMGANVVILSFAAAVIGGFTSLPGTVLGGIALGIIQNVVGVMISTQAISVAPFAIIMLVLIFRPQGIFGGKVLVKKV